LGLFVFFYAVENKLSKKYRGVFPKASGSGKSQLDGLRIMRYDIAESGIFNKEKMTPFDAVGYEDLHNVLRYSNDRAIQAKEREYQQKQKRKK